MADRLHRSLSVPVRVGDQEVFVDLAVGVAGAGTIDDVPDDAAARVREDLVERAGEDMRRRATGTRSGQEEGRERLRLQTDLHGAVDRGEIAVHLQPQCSRPAPRLRHGPADANGPRGAPRGPSRLCGQGGS